MSLTRDLGAGRASGYIIAIAIGLACAVACVVNGRKGRDASALTLAITIALLVTPLVWIHYFALFLVPVAIASPRLGPLWLLPLAYWLCVAGAKRPETWQLLVAIGVTGVLVYAVLSALRTPPQGGVATSPSGDGALAPAA